VLEYFPANITDLNISVGEKSYFKIKKPLDCYKKAAVLRKLNIY